MICRFISQVFPYHQLANCIIPFRLIGVDIRIVPYISNIIFLDFGYRIPVPTIDDLPRLTTYTDTLFDMDLFNLLMIEPCGIRRIVRIVRLSTMPVSGIFQLCDIGFDRYRG